MKTCTVIDCTLRDGGYYNAWNFPPEVVDSYLKAMAAANVPIVELGLRSLNNKGFKGANAFTTDAYLRGLNIPQALTVAVMVNAVELLGAETSLEQALERLFPEGASTSPVQLVRIACHVHEFERSLPAAAWLKERGFTVGFNLMQVADRQQHEIEALARQASRWPVDVLYFADSMGSMSPACVSQVVMWLRSHWQGELGIHTHDNMGLALQNTLCAVDNGVTWLDATVTGMGRGPGNAKTEYLMLELQQHAGTQVNIVPLMSLINQYFRPMQHSCGWGTNTYYYLAGKYGIHPTYIQEMLGDPRYNEEDVLAVINHLRVKGGKRFCLDTLDSARNFYQQSPGGAWSPAEAVAGREVLLLGTGPGVEAHRSALEAYIRRNSPFVMALNTQSRIDPALIDIRVACHPVRLLADSAEHARLPQPLVAPASVLPEDVLAALQGKTLLDFGITVKADTFAFEATCCTLPTSLVFAYALAIAASGRARCVHLAGFDGYGADDPRMAEVQKVLEQFLEASPGLSVSAVTPSRYMIKSKSIYAM
ncbi:aldolase catalytic domain-containing protein [Pseudomonas parasichuanensis]|uniref:aldolase catalytic domain-containing protein n=1 Tax=Pseudomonas parasichuanensis TaxID=2892329 RepID=UPI001F2CA93B|nr:aldolase catalytic domain-containing protein [Pseudomonas parasichuanensis]